MDILEIKANTLSEHAQNWERIEALFNAALYMNAEQRAAYLRDSCSEDPGMLAQVESLLAADSEISKVGALDNISFSTTAIHQIAGHEDRSGETIGPYQIMSEIGAGGMGVVYKALDTRLDRIVAIKCLSSHNNLNEQARQRFIIEARAASRIEHPNICAIYDIGETKDGIPYIVMPYYEGEDLRGRMRGTALTADSALTISGQICDGLTAAHSHGIFHRDIKPANILLTHSGEVKILDFGVAKVSGVENTSTGTSVGTVAYMAPEQIKGEAVDARADIWSLGVVLYEALTGNHPFAAKQSHEIMYSVLNTTPAPISSYLNSDSRVLDRLTNRMLARNPEDRYPNTRMLRDDITEASLVISQGQIPQLRQDVSLAIAQHKAPQDNTHWDELTLSGISEELTLRVGPIATVLVKKYSKHTRSLSELCHKLAEHLPSDSERQAFIKKLNNIGGTTLSAVTTQDDNCPQRLDVSTTISDPECVRKVEEVLIPIIGPVAKSMVKRAQNKHNGCNNICQEIANLLVDDGDKQRFLKKTKSLCHK